MKVKNKQNRGSKSNKKIAFTKKCMFNQNLKT